MPKARKAQISLADTPYYHCVSRCVRRAFLCGNDQSTGRNYEHRRQWVENRIHFLSDIFTIDVCAYAVMSNHTHVVLHINKEKADLLTTKEVIHRWHKLFKGTLLTHEYLSTEQSQMMPAALINTVEETVKVWRQRLMDISWFMRTLNEYIARQANKEDHCTGHFWEGRFKSQALLDEAALAACLAYVDLNPIRAKMADTPEESDHTSIQYRINAAKAGKVPKRLMPFAGNPHKDMPHGLPFELNDYLQLVELTGRQMSKNKKELIDQNQPDILDRLSVQSQHWIELTTTFETCFHHAAGSSAYLERFAKNHQQCRVKGKHNAQRLIG